MAPTDERRSAFDALPQGSPPPGLDTRIRAQAHAGVQRRPRARLAWAASFATVALAVVVVRTLWFGAPPAPTITALPVDAQLAQPESTPDAVVFNRAKTSTAAVADTRGSTFSSERALSASEPAASTALPAIADVTALSELAGIAAESEPDKPPQTANAARATTAADAVAPVDPERWWAQIVTLAEHGHLEKAKREWVLLREAHPGFQVPAETPADIRDALGPLHTD
ncbi:MAG: hypothetical protein AAF460_02150 [Pseudomonadota bacterium]